MRARLSIVVALVLALLPAAGASAQSTTPVDDACPSAEVPDAGMRDAAGTHKDAIDCVVWWGIARGRDAERYDPGAAVTRAQMASFVARLVRTPGGRLPGSPADHFDDDRGSVHHFAINRLAHVGVVAGRGGRSFAPSESVTRGQMATFLANAYARRVGSALPAGSGDAFGDIATSVHRDNINRIARAGIAQGTTAASYDPSAPVTRGQMASFLARTLQAITDEGHVTDSPATLRAASDLRDFAECDELLGHFKERALEQVGPFGLGGDFVGVPMPVSEPAPRPDSGGEEAADGGAPRAGVDYSDTNVQEEGVDEADIVKTDGRRILTVTGTTLRWVDVTGDAPRQAATLDLGEGWGGELLVHSDRALVQRTEWREGPEAVLSIVDVSAPGSLREIDRLSIEGRVLSSRMVDGVARVVLRSDATPTFVQPEQWDDAGFREAERRNREIVEQSTIADWLPAYRLASGRRGTVVACGDIVRPPEFSGLGTLSVVTVDVGGGAFVPDTAASVLAGGEIVYASRTGLYVATSRWDAWTREGDPAADMTTEVHAFDITDPARATYRASGKAPGWVLNQFSLSEHEGHLRVATTTQPPWWDDPEGAESQSYVTVLAQQATSLVRVGQVGGLGRGERIFAVRYMGDTAYVVTFRETDPLYVVDLSTPTAPRVAGELKITGFSAYLHPVAEGLVLGVGQDATEEGWRLGTQLSLFDVSNPANPTRRHQATVEGGSSEVEWDHRAFLHWPATGLVMLPVRNWEEDFAGAIGWDLELGSGFREIGRVSHPRPQSGPLDLVAPDDEWFDPGIRRSLVIGSSVYTLSELGLMKSDVETLAEEGWLSFR